MDDYSLLNRGYFPYCVLITGMLNSEAFEKKDSAVRSLEVLTTSSKDYWKPLLEASKYGDRHSR